MTGGARQGERRKSIFYFLSESFVQQSVSSPCNFPVDATLSSSGWRWQCRWRLALTSNIRHENIKTCQILGFIGAILQSWQGGACGQSGSITWWRHAGATSELRLIPVISQVRYTGYRDRPIHERQNKFLNAARDGSTEIVSTIFIILTIKIELKSPVTGLVLVVLLTYQTNCCNFCEKNFI